MSKISGLLLTAATMAVTAPAAAQTVYTDLASFQAAAGPTTVEDFTGATAAGTVVTTPNFVVTGVSSAYNTGFYNPPSIGTYTADQPVTFTFNSAITSFGLTIIDLGTTGTTTLSAAFGGSTVALISNYGVGGTTTLFAGFVSATPFTSVTLSSTAGGDYVEFDDVRFGTTAAIPEPASWAMMIGGVGLMGGALRRRRQVTTRVRFA